MRNVAEILVRLDGDIKEQASQLAGSMGLSFNQYIVRLVTADLNSLNVDEKEFLAHMKSRAPHTGQRNSTPKKVHAGQRKAA